MMTQDYVRRVPTRIAAFVGACVLTGLLLALQVGTSHGTMVAALYLAMTFAPLGLIDALVMPAPRSGPARLGRIGLLFLILLILSAAWQWRALMAVPSDLQMQIGVESLMRDVAFLGGYLLLEASFGAIIRRSVPG